jgi:Type I phosphodiesterase / nucleotide pyrophosphatase
VRVESLPENVITPELMTNSFNVGACAGDNRHSRFPFGKSWPLGRRYLRMMERPLPRYTCRLPEVGVRAGTRLRITPPANAPPLFRLWLKIGGWAGELILTRAAWLALASGAFVLGCSTTYEIAKLVAVGDVRALRERNDRGATDAERPSLLIVGIDGMKRDVLYELLESGQLPGLELLLGGRTNGSFAHAHLDRSMLAPFPSVTLTGWASIFTGEPPAVSGIPGNEFFIREQRRFVAPIPCSFDDKAPVLETYYGRLCQPAARSADGLRAVASRRTKDRRLDLR